MILGGEEYKQKLRVSWLVFPLIVELNKGKRGVSRSQPAPPPGKAAPGSVDALVYTWMGLVLEKEG